MGSCAHLELLVEEAPYGGVLKHLVPQVVSVHLRVAVQVFLQ